MQLGRKVMWIEGMFLRPHHFQIQDQRNESLIASRIRSMAPFFWGFSELALDEAALSSGRIALASMVGTFADGMPFAFPGDVDSVAPVDVSASVANQLVWLCAPELALGAPLAAEPREEGGRVPTRYRIKVSGHRNTLEQDAAEEPVKTGAPNLALTLGAKPPDGFVGMAVCRVLEVTPEKRVLLDADFIPTVTSADVSKLLLSRVRELTTLFSARGEAIAGRYGVAGGRSVSAQEQFMLLQLCNRWTARLRQIVDAEKIHPLDLHRELSAAAGELATYSDEATRLPPVFPAYDHDDLTATFAPVLAALQHALGFIGDQKAAPIELSFNAKHGIHYNRVLDGGVFEKARLVLVVSAAMPEEELRKTFPRRVSVGSTNDIMEIIRAAERSVPLKPLAHFPMELRPISGAVCFELERNGESWEAMAKSRSIAIHPQSAFDELGMTLWSIRD